MSENKHILVQNLLDIAFSHLCWFVNFDKWSKITKSSFFICKINLIKLHKYYSYQAKIFQVNMEADYLFCFFFTPVFEQAFINLYKRHGDVQIHDLPFP